MKKNFISLLTLLLLFSCNEVPLVEEEISDGEVVTQPSNNFIEVQEILDGEEVFQCEIVSDNLVANGSFEDVQITKSWYLLNNTDDPDLVWDVSWKNKKPCSKNLVEPRLEIQRLNQDQVLELDSDCNGNGQFSLQYPVKKERTKIKVTQKIKLTYGLYYKLTFDVKKRSNNVKEHLRVVTGNKKTLYKNENLSTEWVTEEFYFQANNKYIDSNSDMLLGFDPVGGDSDSLGIYLNNIKLEETTFCPEKVSYCTNVSEVIEYCPVGNMASNRMDVSKVLGASDGEPYVSSDVRFVSLGYGGSIIVKFNSPILNKSGTDLRIYEVSGGNVAYNQYPEEADVYGSNNLNKWVYLGKVKNDNKAPELGEVDLGKMKKAKYIKLIDTSNSSLINNGDGFDLDAMECINQGEYEWKPFVYYFDKSASGLYRVINNKNKIKLKDTNQKSVDNKPVHISLSPNKRYLYSVDSEYPNATYLWDLSKKTKVKLMDLTIGKVTMVGTSSTGQLYVSSTSNDKIYSVDFTNSDLKYLGHVYLNNQKVVLTGGDMVFSDKKMYIATQSGGGRLLEIDIVNNRLEATLVQDNLGKVSGLAMLDYDHFLMSVLNSDYMIELKDGVRKDKLIKGDLSIQGSGGDLGSNPPVLQSKF
jgi:hypothetical protein